ncbi:MAG: flagellar filament capping protein FliD [Betaproteobacteria bacterium]|nr:flagellar filament capping protein FliD [Betaproteobacteria bacterium]
MASISSPGIGSGLDITSIISQLMAVDSQPLTMLQKQQSTDQAELSAYGQLQSALGTLQTNAQTMQDTLQTTSYSATSSDSSTLTATASSSAQAGTYNITVSALAQAQSLTTAAQSSETAGLGTSGAGTTSTIGITVGGTLTNVTITNGTNDSLEGIAQAINNANAGVNASVVNTGTSSSPSYQLLINANSTGTANAVTISTTGDATLSSLLTYGGSGSMTQLVAAQDAKFTVNGLTLTRSSNTVTDAVTGVTLNLLQTKASNTTLTVSPSADALTTALQNFVNSYNSYVTTTNGLTLNIPGGTNNGVLAGDNTPMMLMTMLEQTTMQNLSSGPTGYTSLAQIGITTNADGTLSLDTATLQSAYTANPTATTNLVSQISTQVNSQITTNLGPSGFLTAVKNGINATLTSLASQITQEQTYLAQDQQNYQKEYTALDTLIGSLQTTGSQLTAQLASIPLA